jgi:hypothetical protein
MCLVDNNPATIAYLFAHEAEWRALRLQLGGHGTGPYMHELEREVLGLRQCQGSAATHPPVDYEQLAKAIVAGTEIPDSGWYNSPDDLVAVIRKALECAYRTGAEDRANLT